MDAPAATDRPKLIYFAERPKGLDREGFKARWRQHAQLGMSMKRWSNIFRYAHCDSLKAAGLGLPVGWCDGVAMVWYRSEEARLRHISDRVAAPLMKRDEQETFARPLREVSILTAEHVFQPSDDSPVKLFLRVRGHTDRSRRDFRDWWLQVFGPLLLRRLREHGLCHGYIQNHARASASGDAPPPLCDSVDELVCSDAARCTAMIREVLAGEGEAGAYVSDIKAIATEERVLFSL
ncbi:MAG: EthD domain-containing protein [Kiloniellales bacterium]|nr:EthD domain-containing protein [Kiloniellales bacterium]